MVILQREFVKNSISAKISTYSPVKLLAEIMKNISHCGPTKNCFPHLHMKKCEIRRLLIVPITDLYIKLIIVISLFVKPVGYSFSGCAPTKKSSNVAAKKPGEIYGEYHKWYNKFLQFFY